MPQTQSIKDQVACQGASLAIHGNLFTNKESDTKVGWVNFQWKMHMPEIFLQWENMIKVRPQMP